MASRATPGDRRRHREVPARDALADRHDVGTQPALLGGEERAGPPEPGRDLVADEEHVVGPTGRAERGERVGWEHLHAGRALHERLDHDRGEPVRVRRHHLDRDLDRPRVVEPRGAQHREPERVEHVGAEAPGPEADAPDRVAVVRAAEGEVGGAARHAPVRPVLERDLQGLLDRRGPVGREEEVRAVHRNDPGERLGQFHRHAVAVAEQRAVRDAVELVTGRRVELGHPVAERRDPERGDRVEVPVAVDVDELATLGPLHHDRLVVRVGGHLREPVPDHRGVACDPVRVFGHGRMLRGRPDSDQPPEMVAQRPANCSTYRSMSSVVCCTEIVHCSSSPGVMKMPRLIAHGYEAAYSSVSVSRKSR